MTFILQMNVKSKTHHINNKFINIQENPLKKKQIKIGRDLKQIDPKGEKYFISF